VPHVESLINCFCGLLEKADVTLYESNKRAGKTLLGTDELDEEDEAYMAAAPADWKNGVDSREANIVINQENEIL